MKEDGGREVERPLLSSSKSTVNNAGNYQETKKGESKGGRQKEREEEGKYCSSVPSKHEMLGYFNKKKSLFIWE